MKEHVERIVDECRNIFFMLRVEPEDYDENDNFPHINDLPVIVQNEISLFENCIRGIIYNHFDDDENIEIISDCANKIIEESVAFGTNEIRRLIAFEDISKCAYALMMWLSFKCMTKEIKQEEDVSTLGDIELPTIIKFSGGTEDE